MGQNRRMMLRAAVAAGAALAAAGALTGAMIASAASPPALPRRTPAQLLAAMARARPPAAMTAVISQTASLGLPALSGIPGAPAGAASALSLLSGTRTVQIWYGGPRHLRIAVPVPFGETDLRVNGDQAWLWSSHGQQATRLILPAPSALRRAVVAPRARLRLRGHGLRLARLLPAFRGPRRGAVRTPPGALPLPPGAGMVPLPLTPAGAGRLLALAGPATRVTVSGTTTVAGRAAYVLQVTPRTAQSLVARIDVAVDAARYWPLQVQVFARGMAGPAFQAGFTSLALGRPDPANYTFTPPPGAHVRTVRVPAPAVPGLPGAGQVPVPAPLPTGAPGAVRAGARVLGSGWLTVAEIPVAHAQWGSGRLLHTALVNVLVTSKGEILIGAVTPRVLYADAAASP